MSTTLLVVWALAIGVAHAAAPAAHATTIASGDSVTAFAASGDGLTVAYTNPRLGSPRQPLYVSSGGQRKRVLRDMSGNSTFALSRDGRRLIYSPRGRQAVIVRDLRTGKTRRIPGYTVWGSYTSSASGRLVPVRRGNAEDANHNLLLRDVGILDTQSRAYTKLPVSQSGQVFSAAISGDGTTALFGQLGERLRTRWKIMRVPSRDVTLLPDTTPGNRLGASLSDDGRLVAPVGTGPYGARVGRDVVGRPLYDRVTKKMTYLGGSNVEPSASTISGSGKLGLVVCEPPDARTSSLFTYDLSEGIYHKVANPGGSGRLSNARLSADGRYVLATETRVTSRTVEAGGITTETTRNYLIRLDAVNAIPVGAVPPAECGAPSA